MAQQKKLTRAQKILLSRIDAGRNVPDGTDAGVLGALISRSAIRKVGGRYETTPKGKGLLPQVGDKVTK